MHIPSVFYPVFYTSTAPVLSIANPSFSVLSFTTAFSPVFNSPLMILSASPLPISLEMSRLSGRAPNLGSYPLSDSHCRTSRSTSSVIRRSSSLFWSSKSRISTISRRASLERRLNIINSSMRLRNSGASVIIVSYSEK